MILNYFIQREQGLKETSTFFVCYSYKTNLRNKGPTEKNFHYIYLFAEMSYKSHKKP